MNFTCLCRFNKSGFKDRSRSMDRICKTNHTPELNQTYKTQLLPKTKCVSNERKANVIRINYRCAPRKKTLERRYRTGQREKKKKEGFFVENHLDLAIRSSDMKHGLAIISSGLVKETRISLQDSFQNLQIPKLHSSEEPVLPTRSTTQSLTHLLLASPAVVAAAAGRRFHPKDPLCPERWWPESGHCASQKKVAPRICIAALWENSQAQRDDRESEGLFIYSWGLEKSEQSEQTIPGLNCIGQWDLPGGRMGADRTGDFDCSGQESDIFGASWTGFHILDSASLRQLFEIKSHDCRLHLLFRSLSENSDRALLVFYGSFSHFPFFSFITTTN